MNREDVLPACYNNLYRLFPGVKTMSSLYEKIKDLSKVCEIESMPISARLVELSAEALDMENEYLKINEENTKMKDYLRKQIKIVRHPEQYLTLEGESDKIMYCTHCWDADNKLIQTRYFPDGRFSCPHCKDEGCYDVNLYIQARRAGTVLPF